MRSALKKIRLACVPEQVNIPLALAVERGLLSHVGIDLEVQYVPEGTGKMIDMLLKNETDLALTVTDALIAANRQGKAVQMAGVFVTSPLVWAAAATGTTPSISRTLPAFLSQHTPLKVGISRPGSGSHTMGSYLAQQYHLDPKHGLSFHVAHTFQGLRDGVNKGDFDLFLWETFTTQPYFTTEEVVRVGEVAAPWPAFSFATASGRDQEIFHDQLFPVIQQACSLFKAPLPEQQEEESVRLIVDRMGHTEENARRWLKKVQYNPDSAMSIDHHRVKAAVQTLQEVGLFPEVALQGEEKEDHRLFSPYARLI
eukprot:scaffold1962_cov180-Ochromonas_danica.AAC.3